MGTNKQIIGQIGESYIVKSFSCMVCKKQKTMKCLPPNFKCSDLICDFCGSLSQVKTFTLEKSGLPKQILGAAWGSQKLRIDAGLYFSLYCIRVDKLRRVKEVFFLSKELQDKDLFIPRNPLKETAKRAGWQGYILNIENFKDRFVKLL